jgi:hypothetical protein
MESIEVAMKKHRIHLDTPLASSLGKIIYTSTYAPSRLGYALNASSSSHEWLIVFGASYHIGKDKVLFLN